MLVYWMNYMFNSKMLGVFKKNVSIDFMPFIDIDHIFVYIHIPVLIILEMFYKRLHINKVKQLLYHNTKIIIITFRIRRQTLLSYLLLSVQIVLLI